MTDAQTQTPQCNCGHLTTPHRFDCPLSSNPLVKRLREPERRKHTLVECEDGYLRDELKMQAADEIERQTARVVAVLDLYEIVKAERDRLQHALNSINAGNDVKRIPDEPSEWQPEVQPGRYWHECEHFKGYTVRPDFSCPKCTPDNSSAERS